MDGRVGAREAEGRRMGGQRRGRRRGETLQMWKKNSNFKKINHSVKIRGGNSLSETFFERFPFWIKVRLEL